MSDFDFSAYDFEDSTPVSTSKKSTTKKQRKSQPNSFDFEQYEPIMEEKKKSSFFGDIGNEFKELGELGKSALKGTAEGLGKLGRIMGPLPSGKNTTQQLEEQTENLDQLVPTDEGYLQKAVRSGLGEAPSAIGFAGAQVLPRAIAAGFLGQGAEDLGLPEWARTAAELTAYIGPDVTKKLLSTGKNKEIIDFAKKMGMTDEQITPLVQSDFKTKWLAKLSPKRGKIEETLKSTKEALSDNYNLLQKSEIAGKEIAEKSNGKLINGLFDKLNTIPREIRAKIEPDLDDLLNNKITGSTLMNFWKDINSKFSSDKKHLGILKEPIKEALSSISPEFSKDFEMLNTLYSKYASISSKLKPTLATDLLSGAEALGVFASVGAATVGHVAPLSVLFGEQVVKQFAKKLLISPHLQQLSTKTINALNQNKFNVAKDLMYSFGDQIKKDFPEIAKDLMSVTETELKDLFTHETKEKQLK